MSEPSDQPRHYYVRFLEDTAHLSTVELVELIIDDPRAVYPARPAPPEVAVCKLLIFALADRPSCAAAARRCIEAWRAGQLGVGWMARYLGSIGHPVGAPVVRELLATGIAVAEAPNALVAIEGEGALDALLQLMETAEDGWQRQAAAEAIGRLGSRACLPRVLAATATGVVRSSTACEALRDVAFTEDELIELLRGSPELARLGLRLLSRRAQQKPPGPLPGPAVQAAARTAIAAGVTTLRTVTGQVQEWFDSAEPPAS